MKEFFQANGATILVLGHLFLAVLLYIRYWEKKEKRPIDLDEHEDRIS